MLKYSFYLPDKRFSAYIFSYAKVELAENITELLILPPNGLSSFLIQTLCSNCEVFEKNAKENPIVELKNFVVGQTTLPLVRHTKGKLKYMLVFFNPLGMYQLFGCKMSDLTNKSLDLVDFLGAKKDFSLVERLVANNDSVESQISILNEFFMQQKPIHKGIEIVNQALDIIHSAQGNITVNEILIACKAKRRNLERHFKNKIGLSPKVYAQVFRFRCTLQYLKENPKIAWAELSNLFGYYDQSHLIRYFKEYLKVSPNNLMSPDSTFFSYLPHY